VKGPVLLSTGCQNHAGYSLHALKSFTVETFFSTFIVCCLCVAVHHNAASIEMASIGQLRYSKKKVVSFFHDRTAFRNSEEFVY